MNIECFSEGDKDNYNFPYRYLDFKKQEIKLNVNEEEKYVSNDENGSNEKENTNKEDYDALISCNSIKNLYSCGWDYLFHDKFIKRFEDKINITKFCPLCILGGEKKGKTFIINLLTNNKIKNNNENEEEGLSCKFMNINFTGKESNKIDKSNEKILAFKYIGRVRPLLKDCVTKEIKNVLDNEILKKNYFLSHIKDLKLTAEFINNLLIKNSKIIIVVVNELSLDEQIFLYELKNYDCYQELFIIHNLFNFKNREEMEYYINNTIIGSINFELSKEYFSFDDENNETFNQPYYFVEEQEENEKQSIFHLILGNMEIEDEWIQNFSEATINFLRNKIRDDARDDFFNLDKIIEKELHEESLIDENIEIRIEKDYQNLEDFETGKLKLFKKESEYNNKFNNKEDFFIEKKLFDFNGYIPNYIYYKDEKNSEFVIEIECSGIKDDDISIKGLTRKGRVFFHIKGKQKFPKDIQLNDKPFSVYFSINTEKELIKIDTSDKINDLKPSYEKGIYRKAFPMKKIKKVKKRKKNEESGCCLI